MNLQSVFATATDGARLISELTVLLIVGATLLLALVLGLLWRGAASEPAQIDKRRWLIGGGVVLPVVVLSALLAHGLRVGARLSHDADLQSMEVEVIAHRWWWELRYRDPKGSDQVVLANELHLPLDCAAMLILTSHEVIHSFWVPALAGKVDMVPGYRNRLPLHTTRLGRFRGQCAEYCGTQHANMGLEVVVETPAQFRAWLLNQALPAVAATAALTPGRQVFIDHGCGNCHTVRGTSAGMLGPDLTHVASRRMLAAATLPNEPQSLRHWIRSAQHLKPGNLMPSTALSDEDLTALTAYLGSLH